MSDTDNLIQVHFCALPDPVQYVPAWHKLQLADEEDPATARLD